MNSSSQQFETTIKSSFDPLLTFDCIVKDKRLKAFYYGYSDDSPLQHVLEVGFSDGHHTLFGCSEDHGWFDYNNEKDTEYVTAIKDDLNVLLLLDASSTMWSTCFTIDENKNLFNVYVLKKVKEGKGVVFCVYYNGDYKFDLKKKDNTWEWLTSRKINPEERNDDMVCRVLSHLDEQAKVHPIY